jgi:hypothetical protein
MATIGAPPDSCAATARVLMIMAPTTARLRAASAAQKEMAALGLRRTWGAFMILTLLLLDG